VLYEVVMLTKVIGCLATRSLETWSSEVRPCIGITNYSVRMIIVFNKRILQLKLIETLFSLKLKEYIFL